MNQKQKNLISAILANMKEVATDHTYFSFLDALEPLIEDNKAIQSVFEELKDDSEAASFLMTGLEYLSEYFSISKKVKIVKKSKTYTSNLIAFPVLFVAENSKESNQAIDFTIDLKLHKFSNTARQLKLINKTESVTFLPNLYSVADLLNMSFGDIYRTNVDLCMVLLESKTKKLDEFNIPRSDYPMKLPPNSISSGVRFLLASYITEETDQATQEGSIFHRLVSNGKIESQLEIDQLASFLEKIQKELYKEFPLLKEGTNQFMMIPPTLFSDSLRNGFEIFEKTQISSTLANCEEFKELTILFETDDSLHVSFFIKETKVWESSGYIYNPTPYRLETRIEDTIELFTNAGFEIVEHTTQSITFKRISKKNQSSKPVVH
jgi:hypothetical protein